MFSSAARFALVVVRVHHECGLAYVRYWQPLLDAQAQGHARLWQHSSRHPASRASKGALCVQFSDIAFRDADKSALLGAVNNALRLGGNVFFNAGVGPAQAASPLFVHISVRSSPVLSVLDLC